MTSRHIKTRFYIVFGIIVVGITTNFLAEHYSHIRVTQYTENQTRILDMIDFEDRLDKLRNDITLVQSRIRGYVITSDRSFITNIENEIQQIGNDMILIKQKGSDDPTIHSLLDSLDLLVKHKTRFSYHTLETFEQQGKEATEALLKKGTGVDLRNKIYSAIDRLSQVRTSLNRGSVNSLIKESEENKRKMMLYDQRLPFMFVGFFILLGISILFLFYKNIRMVGALAHSLDREVSASLLKDQFVANVGHEIRTPLNSIIGYTNLLDNTSLTELQRKHVRALRISSELLRQVVNSMLDFSRLESGTVLAEKVEFNPCEMAFQLRSSFEDSFEKKGIHFSIECAQDVPYVLAGDVLKLRQVVTNLVGNALKFTEKGSVTLRVSVYEIHDRVCWLEFSLEDTGIGIEESKLPFIFDRFYQAQQPANRKHEGTGLGLAITKRVVETMGGQINVKSEKNIGTTFTVLLPFDVSTPVTEESFRMPTSVGDGKKVLVVDDNELNRDLVEHVLHNWNFTVALAQNGAEALAKLAIEKYDVVILDIQMPEMDGYELAEKIRKELHLSTPIVALTAYSGKSDIEKCKAAGMNDFVVKPFNELELYGVISRVTEGDKSFLNLQYLRELSKGNAEFEKRIMRQVIEGMPRQLMDLRKALEQNDQLRVATISHDLRTHLSIFKLENHLALSFVALKGFSNNQPVNDILQSFERIENTCHLLLKELKAINR